MANDLSSSVLTDDDARFLVDNFDALTPEQIPVAKEKLAAYQSAKQAQGLKPFELSTDEKAKRVEEWDGLFLNFEGSMQPDKAKAWKEMEALAGDPTEVRARTVNRAYVGEMVGIDKLPKGWDGESLWPSIRHEFARSYLQDERPADQWTDAALYAAIGTRRKNEKDERTMLSGLVQGMHAAAIKGKTFEDAIGELQAGIEQQPGYNPKNRDRYFDLLEKAYDTTIEQSRELMPVIKFGADYYAKAAKQPEGFKGAGTYAAEVRVMRRQWAEMLAMLPKDQQEAAMAFAASAAGEQGDVSPTGEKGFFGKADVSLRRGSGAILDAVPQLGTALSRIGSFSGETEAARSVDLLESQILRRYQSTVDPVKADNAIVNGVYGFANSVPYMVAASSVVGIPVAYTAMANDYRIAAMDEGIPEQEATTIGLAAAVPAVALERVQGTMTFFGKLPGWVPGAGRLEKYMTGPMRTRGQLMARIAGTLGVQVVGQNAEELAQDALPYLYQEIGSWVSDAVPSVDMSNAFDGLMDTRPETFFALLPGVLIGTGAAGMNEASNWRQYLSDADTLKALGFGQATVDRILAADTLEAREKIMRADWDKRMMGTPEQKAAVQAVGQAIEDAYDTVSQPWGASFRRNQAGLFEVFDSNSGKVLATVNSPERAFAAVDRLNGFRQAQNEEAIGMMADYVSRLQQANETQTIDIDLSQSETLADLVKTGEYTPDQARDLIETYRRLDPVKYANLTPEQAQLQGSSQTLYDLKRQVFDTVIKIRAGANPMTMIEERSEAYYKVNLLTQGDMVDAWREQVDGAKPDYTGMNRAEQTRSRIEWFSQYAQAYMLGNIDKATVPSKLRRFLDSLKAAFQKTLELAAKLMTMEKDGKLDADFKTHLARAVGLDEAFISTQQAGLEQAAAGELDADQQQAQDMADGMADFEAEAVKITGNEQDGFVVTKPDGETYGRAKTVEDANILAQRYYDEEIRKSEISAAADDPRFELLKMIKMHGGLQAPSRVEDMRGEIKIIWENMTQRQRFELFRKDAPTLDRMREVLEGEGFDYATPNDLLDAIGASLRGIPQHPKRAGNEQGGATYSLASSEAFNVSDVKFEPFGRKGLGDYIARLDGKEIGFASVSEINSEQPYLANIRINVPYRGKGLGKAFYSYIESDLGKKLRPSPLYVSEDAKRVWRSRAVPADTSKVTVMPDGAELVGPTTFSIRAYHGTPHKVDEFSLSKIGTGEGAQAYGWGLYFAQGKAVAEAYQSALGKEVIVVNGAEVDTSAFSTAKKAAYDAASIQGVDRTLKDWAGRVEDGDIDPNDKWFLEFRAALEELVGSDIKRQTQGNLYTVDLLPDEDEFLDWDKPLSEQSDKVKAALMKIREDMAEAYKRSPGDFRATELVATARIITDEQGKNGEWVYRKFSSAYGSDHKAASKALSVAGIPGIRYLDGGSRVVGEGTRNYVIFDDKLVKVLEENGKPREEGKTFALTTATEIQRMQDALENGWKYRKVTERVSGGEGNFSMPVQQAVEGTAYKVRGMSVNDTEAHEYIAKHGVAKATADFGDETVAMHPATRVSLGRYLADGYDKAGNTEAAIAIVMQAARFGTSAGQAVNQFKNWGQHFTTPEATLLLLSKEIEKANLNRGESVSQEQKKRTKRKIRKQLEEKAQDEASEGGTPKPVTEEEVQAEMDKALKKLPEPTPEQKERTDEWAQRIASTPADSHERAVQTMGLWTWVAQQTHPYDWVDVTFGLWYAGALSGIRTQVRNITGNIGIGAADELTDLMLSDPRKFFQKLDAITKGTARGLGAGTGQARNIIQTGELTQLQAAADGADQRRKSVLETVKLPFPFNTTKFVGRLMAMEDAFFAQTAYEVEARKVAWEMAKGLVAEGKTELEAAELVEQMLNNTDEQVANFRDRAQREWDNLAPEVQAEKAGGMDGWIERRTNELRAMERNAEIVERGTRAAERKTFNYHPEGILGVAFMKFNTVFSSIDQAASDMAPSPFRDTARFIAKYGKTSFLPFVRVPTNVANRYLDYSPAGLVRAMSPQVLTTAPGGLWQPKTDQQRADELKRGLVGTALMASLFIFFRPADPEDPEDKGARIQLHGKGSGDRNRDQAINGPQWKPWSIEIRKADGSKVFFDYKLLPFSPALAGVAVWHDRIRYSKAGNATEVEVAATAQAMAFMMLEGSPMVGLRDFAEVSNTDQRQSDDALMRRMGRASMGFVSNVVVPWANFWRNIDQMTDGTKRAQDTTSAVLVSQIPFGGRVNAPRVDLLGDPVESRPWDFILSGQEGGTPEARIYSAWARVDAMPSDPSKYRHKMDPQQYHEFCLIRGQMLKQAMTANDGAVLKRLEQAETTAQLEAARDLISTISGRITARAKFRVGYIEPNK